MIHLNSTLTKRAAMLASMLLIAVAVGTTTGCKEKGPAEKAGAATDKAIGDVKEAVKDAGEDVKEAAKDVEKKVDAAVEDANKK